MYQGNLKYRRIARNCRQRTLSLKKEQYKHLSAPEIIGSEWK